MTSTFFNFYKPFFVQEFGEVVNNLPILFGLCLFFLSAVLFSQGATITALMPLAMALNLNPADTVWMFPACNGYFLIPAGGAIIGCIAFDRTGTTKIGKYIFNHSYMLPGLVCRYHCISSSNRLRDKQIHLLINFPIHAQPKKVGQLL